MAWAASVAVAAGLACASPWDPPGLRGHGATLARHPGHRLFDATPYLLPARGALVEFLCRWPTARPLRLHLPEEGTPSERRALEEAVAAWEAAGLGVRFERVARERAEIDVRFVAPERTTRAEGTGSTLADCRVADASERTPADHERFAGELAGVALHELAHALGFQGHARFGGGVLARDTKRTTVVGRALLAGEPFAEPTLRALYALPSGTVLVRHPVPAVRTASLDAWLDAAPRGPLVRVGDRGGRIFWRTPDGAERGVTLVSVVDARRRPERLVLLPDPTSP